jgi:hypothetical protein
MKQLLIFFSVILFAGQAAGQTVMKIYQKNGAILQLPLSTIDSITYHIASPSSVSTSDIINITARTATSGGFIPNDGGSPVTARGVCWSTSSGPTIADHKTVNGSDIGTFSSNLSGLSPSTLYYVRAYSTNSVGTTYGVELSFTTSPPPASALLTDFDGNGNWSNYFFSYSNNPATSDSANNTDDPIPGAYSGTKYWKVTGDVISYTYYLDGFGTANAGAFNLDISDSIVFYANSMNNANTRLSITLTDQKVINNQGEVFSYNIDLIASNSWIRYSVPVNMFTADPYIPNNSSPGMNHQYFPSLAAVEQLGFSILAGNGSGQVEANIDDIQIVRGQ